VNARPRFRKDDVTRDEVIQQRLDPGCEIRGRQAEADDVPRPGVGETKLDEAANPEVGPGVELEHVDPGGAARAQQDSPFASERSLRVRPHVNPRRLSRQNE
jgi:hypothetical protein